MMEVSCLAEPYSRAEELAVARRARKGDKAARTALIEHNMRLVCMFARKFASTRIELDELESLGFIGLIKAADTFDPEKGVKFSTYAGRCISNSVLMEVRRRKLRSREVSLDFPLRVTEDGDVLTVADIIPRREEAFDRLDKDADREMLEAALRALSEQEREIVRCRYGLGGQKRLTQKVVAERLHVSQAHISRTESAALLKLRAKLSELILVTGGGCNRWIERKSLPGGCAG